MKKMWIAVAIVLILGLALCLFLIMPREKEVTLPLNVEYINELRFTRSKEVSNNFSVFTPDRVTQVVEAINRLELQKGSSFAAEYVFELGPMGVRIEAGPVGSIRIDDKYYSADTTELLALLAEIDLMLVDPPVPSQSPAGE